MGEIPMEGMFEHKQDGKNIIFTYGCEEQARKAYAKYMKPVFDAIKDMGDIF